MVDFLYWSGAVAWIALIAGAGVAAIGHFLPKEQPVEEGEYEHPIGH